MGFPLMDSKRWRIYLGRAALAVAGPVVFFAGLEGVLFLTGRFEPVRVLERVMHQGKEYWATVPEYGAFALRRKNPPRPQEIWVPVEKEPGTLRVVVVGESAAAGFPGEEFGQARLLDALWRERFPDRPIEVVNLTMVGVSSHILRRFVEEAMAMDPDALVIYMGHNEVIGPYGPAARLAGFYPAGWMAQASLAARNTRTGRFLEWAAGRTTGMAAGKSGKWSGLDEFQGARLAADNPVLEAMVVQTKRNVRAMAETALEAGCKVLVCVPAVNLTDWPPMASAEGDEKISAKAAYAKAGELQAAGRKEEAWELYRKACDLDEMRFRADSRVRGLQREVVAEMASKDVMLVDADIWLHEGNPGFESDREFFLEHVHLTFEGRVAVAALMVDGLAELLGTGTNNWADPQGWWEVFPERVAAARDRTVFTGFDEALMLRQAGDLMELGVFSGMEDRGARKRALHNAAAKSEDEEKQGFDTKEMWKRHKRAVSSNPKDGLVDFTVSRVFLEAGYPEEVVGLIEQTYSKSPYMAGIQLGLAMESMSQNRLDDAERHLRLADRGKPDDKTVPKLRAEILCRRGDFEEAIPFMMESLERDPADRVMWMNLAMVFERGGRPEDAIRTYRKAMGAVPDDPRMPSKLARLLALEGGAGAEVLELARRGVEAEPASLEFRANLAVALAACGKTGEAETEAAKVAEMAAAQGNSGIVGKLREDMKKAEGR